MNTKCNMPTIKYHLRDKLEERGEKIYGSNGIKLVSFLLSKQVALAPKATCIAFGMGI